MSKNISLAWLAMPLIVLTAVAGPRLTASAADYARPNLLTATGQLERMIGNPDLRIVDVRSAKAYAKGHIPGAVHLGADDVIEKSSPIKGVLLPVPTLAAMIGERGIGPKTRVVLYDNRGGFHAARLFWMFEYLGHRDVSILDGGFPKWQRENRTFSRTVPSVASVPFAPTELARRVATADWLLDRRQDDSVVVIDVRPSKMYRAGHIPWAKNIPWSQNLQPDGTLKPAGPLLRHFAAHGVTKDKQVAVHCQVGKAAAHSYFVLRLLGYSRVRSYDRSWAEWGSADDLPKASGGQG